MSSRNESFIVVHLEMAWGVDCVLSIEVFLSLLIARLCTFIYLCASASFQRYWPNWYSTDSLPYPASCDPNDMSRKQGWDCDYDNNIISTTYPITIWRTKWVPFTETVSPFGSTRTLSQLTSLSRKDGHPWFLLSLIHSSQVRSRGATNNRLPVLES